MEFRDTPEEATFRTDVRQFIKENFPKGWEESLEDDGYGDPEDPVRAAMMRAWRKQLSSRGWIAPHWPTEYGGGGMSPTEQFIFNEEIAEARAPRVGGFGVQMIGPTLIL